MWLVELALYWVKAEEKESKYISVLFVVFIANLVFKANRSKKLLLC